MGTDDLAASPRNPTDRGRFQILALDGGGAKALFTAHVLARLEDDLNVNIADCFDLIAGTSAGGIIALALGAGLRPAEIVSHFDELAENVFPRKQRSWPTKIARLWRPAYDTTDLGRVLQGILGDRLLGDSNKRLLIPAYDVQRGQVHIFKTPHHPDLRRDSKIPMADVAMATSAAPTYFAAAKVDGQRLVDGGVWANNPSVVAATEALSVLDVPRSDIRLLNIGTTDEVTHHPQRLDNGGWGAWATQAVQVVLTAGSRGAQGTAAHLVGKDSYARFDAQVPAGLFALDAADSEQVTGLASGVSRDLSPLFSAKFAGHIADQYSPHRPDHMEYQS